MHRRTVLMNPGPVVVDERVRGALGWPDLCHREPEFSALMTRVRTKLTQICGGDQSYATVIITGSGTAAVEATLSSAVSPQGRLLILDNGHYGERLTKIAAAHGISSAAICFGWSIPINLDQVEKALQADSTVTHIAVVHHETSTGMLNPVRELGQLSARYRRGLIVDAISSVGGEPLDVRTDQIDWCIGTANKCIESVPGISFVCAARSSWDMLSCIPPRSFYLNLWDLYVAEDRFQSPPFTPAVQTMFALDIALDLLLEEGVPTRHARYQARAEQLRSGLEMLGLRLLLPPEHRSCTLTAVHLGDRLNYQTLHDRLKEEGFVIYAGQDALKEKVFRLANMGQISAEEIQQFLETLGRHLRDIQADR